MTKQPLTMKQSILWNTSGNIFYQMCQWLLTIIIARFTNMEAIGIFTLAITITNVTIQVASFGMRNFQISDINNEYDDDTYIFSRILTSFASFFITAIFLLTGGFTIYKILVTLVFMIFKISEFVFDVYSGIYQKHWRMDLIGKSLFIRAFLTTVGFTIALATTQDLLFSIILMTLISIIAIYLYDFMKIKEISSYSKNFRFSPVLSLLKTCLPLAIYTFVLSMISSYPRLVLEGNVTDEVFGFYGSISMPTVIIQQLAIQIFTPFLSLFAEYIAKRKTNDFYTLFGKSLLSLVGLTILSIIGAYFLGDFVLSILFTPEITTYTYLLIPLIICTALVAIIWLFSGILTIIRDTKSLLIAIFIGLFVCVISSNILIPTYGLIGTTFAFGLSLTFTTVILFIIIIKRINMLK